MGLLGLLRKEKKPLEQIDVSYEYDTVSRQLKRVIVRTKLGENFRTSVSQLKNGDYILVSNYRNAPKTQK